MVVPWLMPNSSRHRRRLVLIDVGLWRGFRISEESTGMTVSLTTTCSRNLSWKQLHQWRQSLMILPAMSQEPHGETTSHQSQWF